MSTRQSHHSSNDDPSNEYDFARLERAIDALVRSRAQLLAENRVLCEQLEERTLHINSLDEKVIELNQRRQDAIKRFDEVIARLEGFDAAMAAQDD